MPVAHDHEEHRDGLASTRREYMPDIDQPDIGDPCLDVPALVIDIGLVELEDLLPRRGQDEDAPRDPASDLYGHLVHVEAAEP